MWRGEREEREVGEEEREWGRGEERRRRARGGEVTVSSEGRSRSSERKPHPPIHPSTLPLRYPTPTVTPSILGPHRRLAPARARPPHSTLHTVTCITHAQVARVSKRPLYAFRPRSVFLKGGSGEGKERAGGQGVREYLVEHDGDAASGPAGNVTHLVCLRIPLHYPHQNKEDEDKKKNSPQEVK